MTSGFNIALPADKEPIDLSEIAAFWNAGDENRSWAIASADEHCRASGQPPVKSPDRDRNTVGETK